MKRHIPQTLKEGFTYIRETTPSGANILYPEYIGLEMMNRKISWYGYYPGNNIINNIFWSSDTSEVLSSINKLDIDYIFIRKSRIFDDSNLSYIGGYPKSFVERLPTLPFVRLVYENNEASVWEVNRAD
jgi:hypothetical protein